jgi:hypothetical protein
MKVNVQENRQEKEGNTTRRREIKKHKKEKCTGNSGELVREGKEVA